MINITLIEQPSITINPLKESFVSTIAAPPSKAYTLRALFIAGLAEGKSTLHNALFAEDQQFAALALNDLGVYVERKKNNWEVEGGLSKMQAPEHDIMLGNSGVSVRFMASLAALPKGDTITITGDERMQSGRPSKDLLEALKNLGVQIKSKSDGCPPFEIKCGTLKGGETKLKGDVSSQYFSSIMLAAPYAKQDTTILTQGSLRSKPYIDLTIDCMKSFGVEATNVDYSEFQVKAGQAYKPKNYAIEGDFSNAAYYFGAAAITKSKIKVTNLNPDSAQGDRAFVSYLEQMGCKVKRGEDYIELEGAELEAIDIDMGDTPDLVPPLAVVAAFAEGRSRFSNIGHLKYKESNRLEATATELRKCGVQSAETNDGLFVEGAKPEDMSGAEIETYNDHRIAMSFSLLGLKVQGVKILNPKAVAKSFPDYFEQMQKAAGKGIFS